MKKPLAIALFCSLLAYFGYLYSRDESKLPPLHDADVIFQTSLTDQSLAIGFGTISFYIHTGILKHTDHGWVVIHAANYVGEMPLHQWIEGGLFSRFAVYRDRDLTPTQAGKVIEAAKAYYGLPYDHYFTFGKDAIYCSELVYDAFQDAGATIGRVDKIGSLYVNNRFVKELVEERWHNYPSCKGKDLNFEQCYDVIMSSELISPEGIADDPRMEKIFSNYP